jgi:hypothetical protein
MNKCLAFITLLVSVTLVFGIFGIAGVEEVVKVKKGKVVAIPQAFMERSPGHFDADQYSKTMQDLHHWLLAESPPLSPGSIHTIGVTGEDLAGIEDYQCEGCGGNPSAIRKVRTGVVKPVGLQVDFKGLKLESLSGKASRSNGMIHAAPDGGFIWTTVLESPGATALRVHFTDFILSPGAELHVYNAEGQAFGPYTGRGPADNGEFWSNTISGPLAFVQLHYYGTPTESDLGTTGFTIADIGYLGHKFLLPFMQSLKTLPENLSTVETHCSNNADCVEDASCYSGGAINDAKYAVAHMLWAQGPWFYFCSGGLVADKDTSTQIPYFLTANHCLSNDKVAQGLECFWQYWTSSCHGACYDPVGAVPRTLGADVLSNSGSNGDYSLMQLFEDPPPGSVFLGWTTADVANTNNMDLFRISHPDGSPQAYSTHRVDTSAGTCGGWPRGKWIYSRDTLGAIEGGSSGSPVMNLSGQIVGQLTGWCGSNLDDVCDSVNNATVDGAFATYYSAVAQWLDSGGSGGSEMHVEAIDLSIKRKGPKTDAIANVTILDENGDPVSGAEVTGTFTGDANGTTSATTNSSGVATLKLSVTGTVSSFGFCVDDVTHSSYTYNPSANVEDCDNY